ncbi:hypothetical protein [Methanosarcina siciliae]|nr:hypothetical protein [Methanosarcina siciliae]
MLIMLLPLISPIGADFSSLTVLNDISGEVAGFDIIREVINIRKTTGVLPEPARFYETSLQDRTFAFMQNSTISNPMSGKNGL